MEEENQKFKCLICEKEFASQRHLSSHIFNSHKITVAEYLDKFDLHKKCNICGKRIINKATLCISCYSNSLVGDKNPFYGKKHDPKMIEEQKGVLKKISEDLWKNKEYRDKVIKGVSKPRPESFKKEQSIRTKKWFQSEGNEEQRLARSLMMKQLWEDGKIIHNKFSFNKSKMEIKFFEEIKEIFPSSIQNVRIKTKNGYVLPDIFIPEYNLIIEFFGDYWHANPTLYQPEDIVSFNQSAQKIWNDDEIRFSKVLCVPRKDSKFVKSFDYEVVWEFDWRFNHEDVIKRFESMKLYYEWEY